MQFSSTSICPSFPNTVPELSRLLILFFVLALSACDGSSVVVASADDIALNDTGNTTDDENQAAIQPASAAIDGELENDSPNPPPPETQAPTEPNQGAENDPTNPAPLIAEPEAEPVPEPAPLPDPLELGSFELRLDATRFELIEANENGVTVPINISRIDGHVRPVRISVSPETNADGRRLEIDMALSELSGDDTFTSWRAELGVSLAPLVFHERTFLVTADDGREQFTQAFSVDVTPISAPDIYLLIGQSNMEGSSELGSRDTSPGGLDELNQRIRQLNVTQNNRDLFNNPALFTDEGFNTSSPRFITAEDPLHEPRFSFRDTKDGSFIGLGLSFARAALANTSTDIILVPAAWSGRGFCGNDDAPLSWNASESDEQALGGTLLADRALTRLNMTLRDTGGVFRGMLWHQGEADSNNPVCAERYESNVISLANRIRREAFLDARGQGARGDNAAIPFILGTMTRGADERGDFSVFSNTKQRVDNAHRNLPNILPFSETASGDDLVPPGFPCGQGSCIHFGAAAYRELGFRYYQALQRVLDNNL